MFITKDFNLINQNQYKIIRQSDYDIELMSLKTNHCWLIRFNSPELILFHKYKASHKYHRQILNNPTKLHYVIRYITKHDRYISSN